MGVVIPQVITEDKADAAQIVDGGLRFDRSKTNIVRKTFSSAGNRKTWTLSFWHKVTDTSNSYNIFTASRGSSTRPTFEVAHNYGSSGNLVLSQYNGSGYDIGVKVDGLYRDTNAWYHFVIVLDTTQSTDSNRVKAYINGQQRTVTATAGGSVWPSLNADLEINNGVLHNISANAFGDGNPMNGYNSQWYFIDGQALDASYFGFTDSLTNTWRPKKLSSSIAFGTNGFYLPFDGSAPIGQDQSGRGNNWTPVNFGGSTALDKATGALPILNTDGGGKVARVGVRTDSNSSSLVLALPLVGIKSDFSNAINSGTSNKTITNTSVTFSSSASNFYGGSASFSNASATRLTCPDSADWNLGGTFTVEFWVYRTSASRGHIVGQYDYPNNSAGSWTVEMDGNGSAIGTNKLFLGVLDIGGADKNYNCDYASYNQWDHIAVCRENNAVPKIYINGISQTVTTGGGSGSGQIGDYGLSLAVGGEQDGAYALNGYIQDLRIYKGLAKYTSNFIPASTDPDIVPDSPSGVSYSSNVALVPSTDGAVVFDGSGDYLSLADSADWSFGSGAFTVEGFAYFTGSASQQMIVGQWAGGGSQLGWAVMTSNNSSRFIRFLLSTTGSDAPVDLVSSTAFDLNKWNHFALTRSGNDFRLFIDGILAASTTSSATLWNSTDILTVGATSAGTQPFTGFISNFHIVKGTALYTANFTPPTAPISSVANTKLLCCKSNSSATAFDVSPGTITANGNAAASNFNPFTANIKTVRGLQSGYATWDPLSKQTNCTLSNGNLNWASTSTSLVISIANIGMSSGKWYCEHTCTSVNNMFGLHRMAGTLPTNYVGGNADNWGYYADNGNKYNNNLNSSYGSTFTTGDVIGIAFDADTGSLTFYKNGVSQGVAYTGLTNGPYTFAIGNGGASSGTPNAATNFGQKPFKFPPPAGFQPLTLANTPRPTIVRPDQFVGIVTYTGNGVNAPNALTVSGFNFKPDFIWIKARGGAHDHHIQDSVRGTSLFLQPNNTLADQITGGGDVSSFNNDGFTISYNNARTNTTTSYVAWCWKAGGNKNTFNINDIGYSTASAAGLTAGTITPTGASVNTKSGFSIITYTGNGTTGTFSHGLGSAPAMVIIKSRSDATTNWVVWHKSLTSGYYILLNTAGAQSNTSASQYFGNTSTTVDPTSTLITLGGANAVNNSSPATYVAYSWAEIPGFSKFGSYTGNGSTEGPMITTGFRPRYVLIKSTAGTRGWAVYDTARGTYNVNNLTLAPNESSSEYTTSSYQIDVLSNGFKVRTDNQLLNWSGDSYIYAAFAEAPTINLYGAQANAR